jgi:arylsulfatase A-like enzyme
MTDSTVNMSNNRPNILLIHSDQHRFDCVGVNGHPQLQTPHLDRLAREGVNFTHAFTPTPICSPARASLVTGQWPTQHGCINITHTESYHPAKLKAPTVWQLLADSGYRVGMVGKFHQEVTGLPTDHGVEDYICEYQYGPWRKDQGLADQPATQKFFGELDPHITSSQSRMAWEVDNVLNLIDKYQTSSEDDQPWFMRWDPSEPHLPNRIPAELGNLYPPKDIEPWLSFPDPLQNKPYSQQRCIRNWGIENFTWQQWQPIVSRYLAEVTLMDQQLGRILADLESRGILDNTLIIYSTDHGDMCGGHGMIDKHFNMYDDIMRVPLIMRWPGHVEAAQTSDAFVIHELDLATTICTAAGVTCPESFEGRDMVSIANGKDPAPREDVFGMYQGAQQGLYSIRMVRDRAWKYVFHPTDKHELYHLPSDPGELHNRIDDPAAQPELARLRQRLIQWMQQIGDPLGNPFTRRQLEPDKPSPLLPEAWI